MSETPHGPPIERASEVLRTALQLGLTSFGGPIAHLGYFERMYVRERRWLSAHEYASLAALCQVLPGPASSQLGFLIGLKRAGWLGACAAWLGFTLPSALLLFAAATLTARLQGAVAQAALHGLKLVAVAVVAQAVWSMARRLCPDRATAALALLAAMVLLVVGGAKAQLAALALGAIGGAILCRGAPGMAMTVSLPIGRAAAIAALAIFLGLLLALPALAAWSPHSLAALADIFYRAGALVFGGGHVVLPLLRDALVPGGWITDDRFLAGYGLAQAVPGPLFAVAAFLGASNSFTASPAWAAAVAVCFIFLPGLLLATAGVALWSYVMRHAAVRAALAGTNAAVVGILAAALYNPVWTTAVRGATDAIIAGIALVLLERWRVSPIVIVILCVAASGALVALGGP